MSFHATVFDPAVFDTGGSGSGGLVLSTPPPAFYVAGVNRTTSVRAIRNVDISYVLGAKGTASFETVDVANNSTAAAYAPDVDETVAVTYDGWTLFSGTIDRKQIRSLGSVDRGIVTGVEAIDVSSVLDFRLVTYTYLAADGWTLRSIIQHMTTAYLSAYGVTVDPSMAVGPAISEDLVFPTVTVRSAFNQLVSILGGAWVYRLTPSKVLEWFTIGTKVGLTLSTTAQNIVGSVTWQKQRREYFNTVTVSYLGDRVVNKRITMVGNGIQTSFPLEYVPVIQFAGPVVSQGIVVENTNQYYPLYGTVAGVTWVPNTVTNALERTPALPFGVTATWDFAVQGPQTITEVDAAEVAVNGPREIRIDAPEITERAQAVAYAQGLLLQSKAMPRTVTLRTHDGMEWPGTVIELDIPERSISGNWMITETRVRDFSNNVMEYEFTCLEGSIAQQSWVDFLRSAFGIGSGTFGTSGVATGAFSPAASGLFYGDLVSNTGLNSATAGAEASLRGVIPGKALKQGPGALFCRADDAHAWSISADMLSAGPVKRSLMFSPESQKTNVFPWAMALIESPVTGEEYYLVPAPNKVLGIGGHPSVFGITGYGVRVHATDITSEAGIFEWGRSYRSGTPQTYTPTWGNTGTANTVGNATITGRYSKQGNKVSFDVGFVFGSTSVAGSGLFTFSFPSTISTNALSCFTASILDAGSRYFMAVAEPYTTSVLVLAAEGGSNVTATTPMIWTTGDSLRISGWYYEP